MNKITENDTWMCRNMKFISSVEPDILVNTRSKFHISKQHVLFCLLINRKLPYNIAKIAISNNA